MSVLDTLLDELRAWAEPLGLAARDPLFRRRLERLAAPRAGEFDPAALAAVEIPEIDPGGDRVALVADLIQLARRLGDFARQVDALDDAVDGVAGLADHLTFLWLEGHHPVAARVLELLTLYRPYAPAGQSRLRFGRLADLVADPGGVLADEYLDGAEFAGLDPERYADRVAEKLFSRLAGLLRALGVTANVGMPARVVQREAARLPGDRAAYRRMLFVAADVPFTGGDDRRWRSGGRVGISLGVGLEPDPEAPAGRRPLALSLAPRGSAEVAFTRGQWSVGLAAECAGGVARIRPGRGASWSGGAAVGAGLEVQVARLTVGDAPALQVGAADGTRFEIGRVAAFVAGAVTGDGLAGEVGFEVADGQVVIVPGQDSFLRSVLGEGVRIPFDLALRLSSESGISFRGGIGLELELHRRIDLKVVVIERLALRLAVGTDGPLLTGAVRTSLSTSLGVVEAAVEDIGFEVALTREAGELDARVDFSPPTGIGISVDASMVRGGGFLGLDPAGGRYSGVLDLRIRDVIELQALALLETDVPGEVDYSLLAVVFVSFPGIQIGMGFTLEGIGGLLALHRGIDTEALLQIFRDGRAEHLMFPGGDVVARAPTLFAAYREVFPAAHRQFLFGAFVKLGWGTPTLVTAELGLVLEVPDPVRVVVLGEIHVALPADRPIVELNLDVVGVLDLEAQYFHFEGHLRDSRLLAFTLTGGMLVRIDWGHDRDFVLSFGGFHPAFPRPAHLPDLPRLALSLSLGRVLRLEASTYFAITPNTVQFGGRFELTLDLAVVEIRGWLAIDALFRFRPFRFAVGIDAGFEVRVGRFTLAGVAITGMLEGPRPWRIAGKLRISVLFFKIKVSFDRTFGDDRAEAIELSPDPAAQLAEVIGGPAAWSAVEPAGDGVILAPADQRPGLVVDPRGALRFEQQLMPFEVAVDRYEGADLDDPVRFELGAVRLGGAPARTSPLTAPFALGQYRQWSDAERLAAPAFTPCTSGFELGADALDAGLDAVASRPLRFETVLRTGGGRRAVAPGAPSAAVHARLDDLFARRS